MRGVMPRIRKSSARVRSPTLALGRKNCKLSESCRMARLNVQWVIVLFYILQTCWAVDLSRARDAVKTKTTVYECEVTPTKDLFRAVKDDRRHSSVPGAPPFKAFFQPHPVFFPRILHACVNRNESVNILNILFLSTRHSNSYILYTPKISIEILVRRGQRRERHDELDIFPSTIILI